MSSTVKLFSRPVPTSTTDSHNSTDPSFEMSSKRILARRGGLHVTEDNSPLCSADRNMVKIFFEGSSSVIVLKPIEVAECRPRIILRALPISSIVNWSKGCGRNPPGAFVCDLWLGGIAEPDSDNTINNFLLILSYLLDRNFNCCFAFCLVILIVFLFLARD